MNSEVESTTQPDQVENGLLLATQADIRKLDAERDILRTREHHAARLRNGSGRQIARDIVRVDHDLKIYRNLLLKAKAQKQVFVLSAWLLSECFDHVTADEFEGLGLIAGCEVMNTKVGTHYLPIPCEDRSEVFAKANQRELSRVAWQVINEGLSIVALIHSHPSCGREANHPSPTDTETHLNWQASTPLLSAIWARDGFLRCWTVDAPFEVIVIGSGVEEIEPGHFRFDTDCVDG